MPWLLLIIVLFAVGEFLTYSVIRSILELFFDPQICNWIILAEFAASAVYGYQLIKKAKQDSLQMLQSGPDAHAFKKRLTSAFAGLLLFFPGFLTDILALILLKGIQNQSLSATLDRFSPVQGPFSIAWARTTIRRKTADSKAQSTVFWEQQNEIIDIEPNENHPEQPQQQQHPEPGTDKIR